MDKKAKNDARDPWISETINQHCQCGRTHVVEAVYHYDRFILQCGAPVIALRPKRYGPLGFYLSRPNLTRQEYIEKYGSDD
jgi:hypothetical protein